MFNVIVGRHSEKKSWKLRVVNFIVFLSRMVGGKVGVKVGMSVVVFEGKYVGGKVGPAGRVIF